MLLDRGSRPLALQQFDIRGHMHGLDVPQLANPLPFAPVEKVGSGPRVCRTRVLVTDIDGEVFEKAQNCPVPGSGNQRGLEAKFLRATA
jgi:hypothetical protein